MSRAPTNTDDARFSLMSAASASERRNRPLYLPVGAGVLLVIAVIYTAVAFGQSASAAAALRSQETLARNTLEAAAKLKALREAMGAAETSEMVQPLTQIRSRIEEAGIRAGLKSKVPLPPAPRTSPPTGGAIQTKLDYELKDDSLAALLAWVRHAVTDVPGLEVYSVLVKPEAHQWSLRVTFSRWERAGGT